MPVNGWVMKMFGNFFKLGVLKLVAGVSGTVGFFLFAFSVAQYMLASKQQLGVVPGRYISEQFALNQLVVFFLFMFTLAVLSMLRRRGEDEKAAILQHMDREIAIRENAIDVHALVSRIGADGTILAVNSNLCSCLGYTSKDLIGQSSEFLVPADAENAEDTDMREAVSNGRVWSGIQQIKTKSGELRHFATTLLPETNADGHVQQIVEIRTDITESRRSQSLQFLTTALEELQDAVFIYDMKSLTINYANRSALASCGWTKETMLAKRINDTAATFDAGHFRKHVEPLVKGEVSAVNIEVVSPNGPVEISTRLIDGLDGRPNFLSVVRDLSWRREMENEKLRSVSMISHELRTPLTSIHGALRLLRSGTAGAMEEKTMSVVQIADRNTDRLLEIVNDILDFEKIKANKMDFSHSELDLVGLVGEVEQLMTGYAAEHGVDIRLVQNVGHATVLGHSERLVQVMTNLMSNAIKYSDRGGCIVVSLAPVAGGLRVSVADNGPGITKEQRRKLFKPFSQVMPADGRKRPGTGLGLAIVTAILQRLEFPVSVDSEVGAGTVISFDVPSHKIVMMGAEPAAKAVS